ncbi:MAG: glycosyl transferase family 1 [Paludibacteraceae bacterium]
MKRVLIITYYWIPSGGAGVQRWVKFTKYFRSFGWEPIIYAPQNPEYPSEDFSFQKDIASDIQVIKTPIWEPYNIYRNIFGKKGEKINAGFISENKKSGWKEKLSIWIRGNFLIPDPRKFWVKPSVKYLKKILENNPVDAFVTTGPPHSMHLIGLGLKKHFPRLAWIADFRDPWTNIDFYKELNLTAISDSIHRRLERKVIQSADCVVVVSNEMVKEFGMLNPHRICLLTNGYDDDDTNTEGIVLDERFTLSHIGTLNYSRNPKLLWRVLSELCKENAHFRHDLQIQLVGKTDFIVREDIHTFDLSQNLHKINYLNHADAIRKQNSAQVLLLLINNTANAKGILTGKFFEYLAAKRPILAIGPTDGDVAKILHETQAGKVVDFKDFTELKNTILEYYHRYKHGSLSVVGSNSVEKYSRKELTKQLAELLNEITISSPSDINNEKHLT